MPRRVCTFLVFFLLAGIMHDACAGRGDRLPDLAMPCALHSNWKPAAAIDDAQLPMNSDASTGVCVNSLRRSFHAVRFVSAHYQSSTETSPL